MITSLLSVAAGGAIGASLRYASGVALVRLIGHTAMPIGVLAVNIVGSFLMGVFIVTAAHKGLAHLNPFIAVGILGGFTTFSSFSLETITLIERGEIGLAGMYILLSVSLSVGALMLGLWLTRGVFA